VIVGQSNIKLPDVATFRSLSGLPANVPTLTLVPGQKDPLIVDGDVQEATIDIEWAGAVAKNASIIFVLFDERFWFARLSIQQALAPVISISYGGCETHILHFGIQWSCGNGRSRQTRKASPL